MFESVPNTVFTNCLKPSAFKLKDLNAELVIASADFRTHKDLEAYGERKRKKLRAGEGK